jgi:hypothetical protein
VKKIVYNLEFPSWCPEITIFGYRFSRVVDYEEKLFRLQHLVPMHSEFQLRLNTGEHSATAIVDMPEKEETAVLEWADANSTALNDIILLLSIFRGRDIFVTDISESGNYHGVITIDPRIHQGGGVLECSIPYKASSTNTLPYPYDIGFEEGLNQIYQLIRSEEWQHKYKHGYFLFLANMAFHRQPLEARFIQCWTIWEHLFAILNQSWLSEKQISLMSAPEKISFLLVGYALKREIAKPERKRIEELANIRNRLVHFGRFPERGSVHNDAILFTRLTEFIMAKILNLSPSNLFNTMEKLEEYLNSQDKKK